MRAERIKITTKKIKGLFSPPIVDFDTAFNLAKSSFGELKIDSNISKKVWVYVIKNDKVILVNNQPFPSSFFLFKNLLFWWKKTRFFPPEKAREQTAKFLNTIGNTIRYYTDSWKSQGLNGWLLFNKVNWPFSLV